MLWAIPFIGQAVRRCVPVYKSPYKHICTHFNMAPIGESRVFAISDLHVDYPSNREFVDSFSAYEFHNDALIVAGDVTDNLVLLESTLKGLVSKFKQVFYVPGNHELWIRSTDTSGDSISKFHAIINMCEQIGVHTSACRVPIACDAGGHVWVVPLFSWYATPEDDSADSLFVSPKTGADDPIAQASRWMDNHLCIWPRLAGGMTRAEYFASLNESAVTTTYDAPVISFSHFVPRRDLIAPNDADKIAVERERSRLGLAPVKAVEQRFQGAKGFNFTRYAGCQRLERHVRQLSSAVHVYGHQHRNRDRIIDDVRYVSHCLGSVNCQRGGWTWGIADWCGPKQVWP